MGRMLLVLRLAARDLCRRPVEAGLLLLAILAATTTLTLGLVLHGITDRPYETTREATAGPDVEAVVSPPRVGAPITEVKELTDAQGVVGHSGPYPIVSTILEANGKTVVTEAEGRDTRPAAVDQPKSIKGGWVREGTVVLEAGYADALGVGPGDEVTLKPVDFTARTPSAKAGGPGRQFEVAGVAVTAAAPPYPEQSCLANVCMGDDVGLIWLTRADALPFAPPGEPPMYVLNLKLRDPATAPAFVDAQDCRMVGYWDPFGLPPDRSCPTWQDIRERSANLVENQRRALLTGAWLLAFLAVASVAVLVGGRMADQMRRVGLLKAVGATPGLVAAILLAEYVVVALVASAAGLAIGSLTAPVLSETSAGLLGSVGARTVTLSTIVMVTAVALAVAVAATFVPAVRGSRTSTVLALADAARPPRRTGWMIAASARLPVPLLLGLRVAARRPRRTILTVVSIAITVSGLVAALAAHADVADSANSIQADQLNRVLLAIVITLLLLAAVNAIFVTWTTALDNRHSSALTRALGATPRQVSAALSAAQVLPALVGALLGIPGGLELIAVADPDSATPMPQLWQLLAVVPCTELGIAALTAIPARIGARRPVADVLRTELA
jgi:ABC-type lipoprotein release transport system permease subunit